MSLWCCESTNDTGDAECLLPTQENEKICGRRHLGSLRRTLRTNNWTRCDGKLFDLNQDGAISLEEAMMTNSCDATVEELKQVGEDNNAMDRFTRQSLTLVFVFVFIIVFLLVRSCPLHYSQQKSLKKMVFLSRDKWNNRALVEASLLSNDLSWSAFKCSPISKLELHFKWSTAIFIAYSDISNVILPITIQSWPWLSVRWKTKTILKNDFKTTINRPQGQKWTTYIHVYVSKKNNCNCMLGAQAPRGSSL